MRITLDSAGGVSAARRTRKTAARRASETESTEAVNLPATVDGPRTIPAGSAQARGDAAIHAQVLGERRGLKAGPTIHDHAKATYNQTEWSGSKDRRRPKGATTKTQV